MTFNGVISLIMRCLTKFDSFAGRLRHSGGRQTYMSAKYCLTVTFGQN